LKNLTDIAKVVFDKKLVPVISRFIGYPSFLMDQVVKGIVGKDKFTDIIPRGAA
jgi:hypothetical protein